MAVVVVMWQFRVASSPVSGGRSRAVNCAFAQLKANHFSH